MGKISSDLRSDECIKFLEEIHAICLKHGLQLEMENYDYKNGLLVIKSGSEDALSPDIYKEFLLSSSERIYELPPEYY